ncbi:MAG TPA: hypothetical protein ENN56_00720 [Firmicutes bacterium]|nr:hypothetical protein [Bacillota bacterium]
MLLRSKEEEIEYLLYENRDTDFETQGKSREILPPMNHYLAAYRVAWLAGLAVTVPVWMFGALTDRWQVRRRFRPRVSDDGAPAWWWHGASAGEVRGLTFLLDSVERTDNTVVDRVSATTESGLAMWHATGRDAAVLPVDLRYTIRRVLPRNLRLAVLSETELWPMLLDELVTRRVPIVVASARLSERALSRLRATRLLRANAGALYVCAQTDEDGQRYRDLGVPHEHIAVTGSLKWPRRAPAGREAVRRRFRLTPNMPCVVAGSIRRDEIEVVASALARVRSAQSDVRVIIAPRMPSDVSYAQQRMWEAGFEPTPYDAFPEENRGSSTEPLRCTVVGTMGELATLYAAADVAVVGGGWEPVGGHNPFEAAVYRIPIVYGPYMRQPGVERLEAIGQATRATDERALASAILNGLSAGGFDAVSWPDPVEATLTAWRVWGIV